MWAAAPVWTIIALSGCGSPAALPPDLFPATAAGVWHRTATWELTESQAPDPVPRNEIERIAAASYDGPGRIEARVYALHTPEVGVTLAQRWRPSSDTVFFNSGRCFVVLKWQAADRKALQEFVRGLEGRLAAAKPR